MNADRFEGGTVEGYNADYGGVNLLMSGNRSIPFLRGGRDNARIWIVKN